MSREYFTWEEFTKAVDYFERTLSGLELTSIYAPPRGGLPLAVALSHRLDLPLILDKSQIESTTLVVDDICDSGMTLSEFEGHVTATIHRVPGCNPEPFCYYGVRVTDWVEYPWEKRSDRS